MASVGLRLSFASWLATALLATPFPAAAQELWPDMDSYVRHSVNSDGTALEVANLYGAALVAGAWTYKCDRVMSEGFVDAARSSIAPWEKGQKLATTRLPEPGCTTTVTALIFADGKEVGDPAVLKQLHEHRVVAWDEIHRLRQEDILSLKVPLAQWDPVQSVAKLQARL